MRVPSVSCLRNIIITDDSIEIVAPAVEEEKMSQPPQPPPPMMSSTGELLTPRSSQRKGLASDGLLTDEQIDLVLKDLAEEERSTTLLSTSLGKQTWSRYLVIKYLQHYKWYNPNRDNPASPSLSKGWAYFEHFTLPRRFEEKSGGVHIRAPPGENGKGTRLYSAFMTPMESLSDWGIGMGMYFSSLSAVFVIFILAGSLNIANMIYYSSTEYDPNLTGFSLVDMLQYSTVCTDREWVICTQGCSENIGFWNTIFTNEYYGTSSDGTILINKTKCNPAEFTQGMVNYGTLLLLILCMSLYMWYLKKREVRFDEDNTSAPDYSIVVHNPPSDDLDPDDYRDFFDQFSDKGVTLVTVALNNEVLLDKLVQRRMDIKMLKRRLPPEIALDFDDEGAVDTAVENAKRYRWEEEKLRNGCSKFMSCIFLPFTATLRCLGFSSAEEDVLWKRIKKTTEQIQELQQQEYQAAGVYITFETEEGQRTALEALNASEMEVMTNTAINLDSSSLFKGKVLRVTEASEPNAVRWTDLNYSRGSIYLRLLITFCITLGLVAFSAFILQLSRTRVSTILFSVILSTFNAIVPIIVRKLVSYEKHFDEGSIQASLYLKITVFRWVNTAIITRLITPFLVTLGENKIDLINTVNALMISEMIMAPLLRYFDVMTILKRHYFAPRAKSEEELFSCFSGGWYNLGERYTDFTKVLLLCTFYSAFYPLIYFLGAAILFGQYWMDKFLLLSSWQKAPFVGPETARFSRTYFNTAAILLGAISSGYAYARSPFTNLCSCADNDKECPAQDQFVFNNVMLQSGDDVEVQASNELFYFCNQKDISFPPIPSVQGSVDKWMTDGQEHLTGVYGVTCLILLILYFVVILGQQIFSTVLSLVKGMYKPKGCTQHKDFSSGIGLESFAYIPQLERSGFHFPLLACNIDDIDVKLIGWKDPNCRNKTNEHRNYDNHNLIFDVPHEKLHRSRHVPRDRSKPREGGNDRPIFSVVKHYPPAWALRAKENNQSS
mmetsp:Transcript_5812/g.13266  ORF Transcript_5812/g.13266 Transcript_5812/m.13266 type:complete len:1004 (-) Transcript_5812:1353-4364(-)